MKQQRQADAATAANGNGPDVPAFTLLRGGQVFAPEPLGREDVLIAGGRIVKVGPVDRAALDRLGVETEVIDARGCVVAPGLIDPHQHLLGGSGEDGFSSATPEFFLGEIARAGITTVVGALGVDTTMKTMPGLLAKVKALREEGLNAYCWTGGYDLPPSSVLDTVRDDILFIDEVIGAGELAISDARALGAPPEELARVATHCYVGGMLARKAGLVHVHVGTGRGRLRPIRDALDGYDVEPCWFYATHVERGEKLMDEAIALARRGMPVDIDTVEQDLPKWLRYYRDGGGPMELLTLSSDASINSPRVVLEQIRVCVWEHGHPLETVLALATRNTARILKLGHKGELKEGKAGDVLLLEEGSLEVVHVLSAGRVLVRDGRLVVGEPFLEDSNREIRLVGEKVNAAEGGDGG
ncbi:MAG TPA: amidohydrolase family protein [Longimicrobium sp.]|nr:amidohydrolase family protein [Longimicrobium sp.]